MFCRRAWQRVAPSAWRALKRAPRNGAPGRHMASGLPGGSFNTTYFVLCGGGLTAALVYAYKTINSDTQRYESRLASMGSTAKGQFEAAASPAAEPAPAAEAEVTEVVPESVSAAPEAAAEAAAAPEASSEAAAAEDASEEPAVEVAEASEAAEEAASESTPGPAEETSAQSGAAEGGAAEGGAAEGGAAEGAGTAAVEEAAPAPPAAPEVAA